MSAVSERAAIVALVAGKLAADYQLNAPDEVVGKIVVFADRIVSEAIRMHPAEQVAE